MFNTLPETEQKEYIDLETALSRVRGNKKIFVRMLGLYLNSAEFISLEEALAEDDTAKAADIAHAIKGMSANLGLDKVAELSAVLMQQLRAGEINWDDVVKYRKALEITLDGVRQTSKKLEEEI